MQNLHILYHVRIYSRTLSKYCYGRMKMQYRVQQHRIGPIDGTIGKKTIFNIKIQRVNHHETSKCLILLF